MIRCYIRWYNVIWLNSDNSRLYNVMYKMLLRVFIAGLDQNKRTFTYHDVWVTWKCSFDIALVKVLDVTVRCQPLLYGYQPCFSSHYLVWWFYLFFRFYFDFIHMFISLYCYSFKTPINCNILNSNIEFVFVAAKFRDHLYQIVGH